MKIKYVVQDSKTGLYLRRIFVVPRDAKIPQPKEDYLEVTWVHSLDDASHIVSQMGAIMISCIISRVAFKYYMRKE